MIRLFENGEGEVPTLSFQPHADEEVGKHYILVYGTASVLNDGATVGSEDSSDYTETTFESTIKLTVKDSILPAFDKTPG